MAIQTGGVGPRQFDNYRGLATLLETVIGDVPRQVAVVTFDSEPVILQKFTPDLHLMDNAVQNLDPGDPGAAILDTLAFSVDLLRKQPPQYRRAILLLSETLDRGSKEKLEDALRAISDTNTAIYSLAFSSGKAASGSYASRELPTQPAGVGLTNPNPNPPHGCMGKDPDAEATRKKANQTLNQAYDCLGQLIPPLALAKLALIAATDGLRRNVPETVAHLTGGEYFSFNNTKSLERGLLTISNHVPNRYVLSFQPQSPQPGIHAISVQLKDHIDLTITARSSYWADDPTPRGP